MFELCAISSVNDNHAPESAGKMIRTDGAHATKRGVKTSARFIDTASRFPHYLTDASDKATMAANCERELSAWRTIVAHHHALPTVDAKVRNRRRLESAFDELRAAWHATQSSERTLQRSA